MFKVRRRIWKSLKDCILLFRMICVTLTCDSLSGHVTHCHSVLSRMVDLILIIYQDFIFNQSCPTCWLCRSKRHILLRSTSLPANVYPTTEVHTQMNSKMTSSCGKHYERRELEALCMTIELTLLFCRFFLIAFYEINFLMCGHLQLPCTARLCLD